MTDTPPTDSAPAAEGATGPHAPPARVLVTGASGFVGGYVVRGLIAAGHVPICLVRDRERMRSRLPEAPTESYQLVVGNVLEGDGLLRGAQSADAAIHLVGIIQERRLLGQTFERVHVQGTQRVLEACKAAGIKRYLHMSALGTRRHAASEYHRTKWRAEGLVHDSGLDWTLFRPSIIHGPDGEFMRMMRSFVCDATVMSLGFLPMPFPVIPFFGDGQARVQPVSVRDVAQCFVAALARPETIRQTYELGGPEAMTWKEFYRVCRDTIPGAKRWKPMIGQPVWAAKLMAMTLMKLPVLPFKMRFNVGQVQMSQEDSVCETRPVEETFGIRLRDFRQELREYAARIE